jgi:hypothetical protein
MTKFGEFPVEVVSQDAADLKLKENARYFDFSLSY